MTPTRRKDLRRGLAAARRRKVRHGLAASAAILGLTVSTIVAVDASQASWNDSEWDHAAVGTLDCTVADGLASQATGRVLDAALLGVPIDPLAALGGLHVENDGGTAIPTPGTADGFDEDPNTYTRNLNLGLLSDLISVNAGLGLPLELGAGVYGQYGQARPDGRSIGAAGVVGDQGAVDLDMARDPSTPDIATINLRDLVLLGSPLAATVTDLNLNVGAVASKAELDGCEAAWVGMTADTAKRDYGIAGLDLTLESDTVGALATALDGTIEVLETGINSTLIGLTGGISDLLDDPTAILRAVGLGVAGGTAVTVDIGEGVDLSGLTALLRTPVGGNGVLIDLQSGTVQVDLATIAGKVYGSPDGSLNGLTPNTSVLTAPVLAEILSRVDAVIDELYLDIRNVVRQAILQVKLTVDVAIPITATVTLLGIIPLVNVDAGAVHVTLTGDIGAILGEAGYDEQAVTLDVSLDPVKEATLLGLIDLPAWLGITAVLNALIDVVNVALGAVTGSLEGLVNVAVKGALAALLDEVLGTGEDGGLVGGVLSGLTGVVTALVTELSDVLDLLTQVATIDVNAQPDQDPNPGVPGRLGEPAGGEFFVSALRVGVLDGPDPGAGSLLNLWLATSSVGPNSH
ncbi:choice-of-anchor G family protein [Microbacterium sp. GXF7504]